MLSPESGTSLRIAIQGELGSNSHLAALHMLGDEEANGSVEIVACALSADVVAAVLSRRVYAAVLPIENSLHGSVAEHYDLLLEHAVRIDRESLLRIRHNVIAAPGVRLAQVRHVLSHPVALSQCRRWIAAHPELAARPFYDTAGSVKHLMERGLRDTAGIAPALAARQYGADVLAEGVEDNHENYTRFHLLRRSEDASAAAAGAPDKMSLAFALEHRPGSLVTALEVLAEAGVDLTKIESRPVHGSPWEYIFFVDFRFPDETRAERALTALRASCRWLKVLGTYAAAV